MVAVSEKFSLHPRVWNATRLGCVLIKFAAEPPCLQFLSADKQSSQRIIIKFLCALCAFVAIKNGAEITNYKSLIDEIESTAGCLFFCRKTGCFFHPFHLIGYGVHFPAIPIWILHPNFILFGVTAHFIFFFF